MRVRRRSSMATVVGHRSTARTRRSAPSWSSSRPRSSPASTRSISPRRSRRKATRSSRSRPDDPADPGRCRARAAADRRSPRDRSRRERMPRAGMLLQVDGSRHDWLEGRGPVLTLIGAIDDATGIVSAATFRAAEDAAGYLEVFRRTVVRYGRPARRVQETSTGSSSRIPTGRRRSPSSWPDGAASPRSAAPSTRRASAGSGRAARRPKAGSSACGAPSRTGSSPSCAGRARPRSRRRTSSSLATCPATTSGSRSAADAEPAWRPLAGRARPRCGVRVLLPAPGGQRRDARLGRHEPRPASPSRWSVVGWTDGHLEERLDGSLWVGADGQHHRLVEAPPVAPVLRARKLGRIDDLRPVPEPPVHRAWRRQLRQRPPGRLIPGGSTLRQDGDKVLTA